MKFKPDWEEAKARLSALWNGKQLDRACVAVTAPVSGPPWPVPASAEAKWLDPAYVTQEALTALGSQWWGGEAVPSHLIMGGWVVHFGAAPRFSERTIWFDPFSDISFDRPPCFRLKDSDPWVRRHEAVYRSVAQAAGWDDFLLGQPCLLPASDILSACLGTERFLEALVLEPEWVEQALRQMSAALLAEKRRLRKRVEPIHAFWYGVAGWMPFWAPNPFLCTQSDVSCMMSPEHFERFVMPELLAIAEEYGAIWYHLDGREARHHLPRLLSLPTLRVLQYTPSPNEPPNGVAHLEFYRTVQAAGRILHLNVMPDQVIPLVKELDRAFLMLQTRVNTVAEGEALLKRVERLS